MGWPKGVDKEQEVETSCQGAQVKQRVERADRTGPGKCYRLYMERAYWGKILLTAVPEIQKANRASVVLSLKAVEIKDTLNPQATHTGETKVNPVFLRGHWYIM